MQTIFPILRYRDARAAIHWLYAAFGFVERCCIPDDGAVRAACAITSWRKHHYAWVGSAR
jgi:uncharacterized glyoxalase superfamily protein PhnB